MTPKQREAYEVIRSFQENNGYTPTVRELGELLGKSKTAAHSLVDALVRKGYASRTYGLDRSIILKGETDGSQDAERDARHDQVQPA